MADHSKEEQKAINSTLKRLQETANGRACAASEATHKRIQDLEESVSRGEGIGDELNVHILQTNARQKFFSEAISANSCEVRALKKLVESQADQIEALTKRLEQLEAVPTRRCTSCSKVIRPTKPTHLKCDDCHLSKKLRSCTTCSEKFYPDHYSYKICHFCYIKKKAKKQSKNP